MTRAQAKKAVQPAPAPPAPPKAPPPPQPPPKAPHGVPPAPPVPLTVTAKRALAKTRREQKAKDEAPQELPQFKHIDKRNIADEDSKPKTSQEKQEKTITKNRLIQQLEKREKKLQFGRAHIKFNTNVGKGIISRIKFGL
jgi:hypothetical protein